MKLNLSFIVFMGFAFCLGQYQIVAAQQQNPELKLQQLLQEAVAGKDPITVLTVLKVTNELGQKTVSYDLCQLDVPVSHLFCKQNLKISRIKMPQFIGSPRAGSQAAALKLNQKGEVDATEQFKEFLRSKGYVLNKKKIPAVNLKATQSELIGSKIAGMWWALKKNLNHPGIRAPLFISSDNYILDGHHRWAAIVSMDYQDGKLGDIMMDTIQVNVPIRTFVDLANQFTKEFGILPSEGVVQTK